MSTVKGAVVECTVNGALEDQMMEHSHISTKALGNLATLF